MDAEQLILEVRNRRCLWDQRDRSYKNRNIVEKLWQEVAEKMQTPSKYIIILLKTFFVFLYVILKNQIFTDCHKKNF